MAKPDKRTILVVDDEADVRNIVQARLMKNPDYHVVFATNGGEALEMIQRERPDLIILDWLMPGVNGLEVMKILQANPEFKHIPIIMMTVKGEKAAQATGYMTGAFAYLIKPFEAQALMEKVETALNKKR